LAHHDEVAQGEATAEHRAAKTTWVPHENLDHDPRPVGPHGPHHVRDRDVAEQAVPAGRDGDVAVALEGDEPEDPHHRLPDGEVVDAVDELTRAAPAEVVDPVVAVRSDTELAEPAE